jgi:hypothetical protein
MVAVKVVDRNLYYLRMENIFQSDALADVK